MKKLLYILLLLIPIGVLGQQLPHFNQFYLNQFVINPGYTGSQSYWSGQSVSRYQWVGIDDAPRTHVLSLNGPLNSRKVGLGGYFFSDVVGPTRRIGFNGSYAYHLNVTDDIRLGMGVTAGVLQFMVDGSKVDLDDPNDPAFSNGVQSTIIPDAGVGFYLNSDEFYVGVTASQLIANKIQFFDDYSETDSELSRHFIAYAGYKFQVTEDIMVEPAALVKYIDPIPVQFEAALRGVFRDMVWLGGSYRMDESVGLSIGYVFQSNLTLGYSYEIATSNLSNYSSGSHELVLGIRFRER